VEQRLAERARRGFRLSVKDWLRDYMAGKAPYHKVLAEIKRMKMNPDVEEHFLSVLDQLREIYEAAVGNTQDPMDHMPRLLDKIPSEFVEDILIETIKQVRSGINQSELWMFLANEFGIGNQLCLYFYNEALNLIRMHELSDENMKSIGELYMSSRINEMIKNGSLVLLDPKNQ